MVTEFGTAVYRIAGNSHESDVRGYPNFSICGQGRVESADCVHCTPKVPGQWNLLV